MSGSSWVNLDVLLVKKETTNAFLLTIDGVDGDQWVPKSQIADPDGYEEGDQNVTISITWMARQKNIGD